MCLDVAERAGRRHLCEGVLWLVLVRWAAGFVDDGRSWQDAGDALEQRLVGHDDLPQK